MPWSVDDVDAHYGGLTPKQKRQWLAVANSVMESSGDDSEAIRKANSTVNRDRSIREAYESPLEARVGVGFGVTLKEAEAVREAWNEHNVMRKPNGEFTFKSGSRTTKGHNLSQTLVHRFGASADQLNADPSDLRRLAHFRKLHRSGQELTPKQKMARLAARTRILTGKTPSRGELRRAMRHPNVDVKGVTQWSDRVREADGSETFEDVLDQYATLVDEELDETVGGFQEADGSHYYGPWHGGSRASGGGPGRLASKSARVKDMASKVGAENVGNVQHIQSNPAGRSLDAQMAHARMKYGVDSPEYGALQDQSVKARGASEHSAKMRRADQYPPGYILTPAEASAQALHKAHAAAGGGVRTPQQKEQDALAAMRAHDAAAPKRGDFKSAAEWSKANQTHADTGALIGRRVDQLRASNGTPVGSPPSAQRLDPRMTSKDPVERAKAEFAYAVAGKRDTWVPGAGGTETPFNHSSGHTLQRVYNPKTGEHGYLDTKSDTVYGDKNLPAWLSGTGGGGGSNIAGATRSQQQGAVSVPPRLPSQYGKARPQAGVADPFKQYTPKTGLKKRLGLKESELDERLGDRGGVALREDDTHFYGAWHGGSRASGGGPGAAPTAAGRRADMAKRVGAENVGKLPGSKAALTPGQRLMLGPEHHTGPMPTPTQARVDAAMAQFGGTMTPSERASAEAFVRSKGLDPKNAKATDDGRYATHDANGRRLVTPADYAKDPREAERIRAESMLQRIRENPATTVEGKAEQARNEAEARGILKAHVATAPANPEFSSAARARSYAEKERKAGRDASVWRKGASGYEVRPGVAPAVLAARERQAARATAGAAQAESMKSRITMATYRGESGRMVTVGRTETFVPGNRAAAEYVRDHLKAGKELSEEVFAAAAKYGAAHESPFSAQTAKMPDMRSGRKAEERSIAAASRQRRADGR